MPGTESLFKSAIFFDELMGLNLSINHFLTKMKAAKNYFIF
jgi:hypothetical protein